MRGFSPARVRLTRFLHEEMGFDGIAFEGGLPDCRLADEAVPRTELYTISAEEWGTDLYRMAPRQQYDGIFFVHDVSVPEYPPPL